MTRRERLEAKIALRQEWADKAADRGQALHDQAHQMASCIPFGQPILVGHHSEKRDRGFRNRIHNKFGRAFEQMDLAKHHEEKAAGLEHQLEHSIFSDDPDAIEAIEARIRENEAKRDQMKVVNKLYKKADVEGLQALGIDYERLKAKLAAAGGYWGSAPHLPYELTNLGARIRDDKKRLEAVRNRQQRAAKAEEAGGVMIERHANGYATVVFAEKPERAILNDLRNAGFRWGGGSWFGEAAKLPESVTAETAAA